MSVGFGFSVGDFLAARELVSTVIDALHDNGEAANEHRELLRQLYSLETALIHVKRLDLDDYEHAELLALRQAASQCQHTITAFWDKIQTYPRNSGPNAPRISKLKDRWMRVKWAVCKKDDVFKFKADLAGHTESIQLLLSTLHLKTMSIQSKKQQSLGSRIQNSYCQCMRKLSLMGENITTGLRQSGQLLEMMTQVMQTNVRVFQMVLMLQNIITHIPSQVERQQPVFLIDGLGKASPFYLEFVRSAEALIKVLEINFRAYEADEKILCGDFVIEDTISKQDIDLDKPWELCFFPGQRVEMSMLFHHSNFSNCICPKCGTSSISHHDEENECPKCGLLYRRVERTDPSYTKRNRLASNGNQQDLPPRLIGPKALMVDAMKRERQAVSDGMKFFRKVRILSNPSASRTSLMFPSGSTRCTYFRLDEIDWVDERTGICRVATGNDEFDFLYLADERESGIELFQLSIGGYEKWQKQSDSSILWTDEDYGERVGVLKMI